MSYLDYAIAYWALVVLIAALSVASVIWFFRARRKLILFMRDVTITLEKHFNPSSKDYQLLGYLVGYKARYVLPGKHRVYILFTTTPRHSLFYYPIIKLAGRKDRLEIAIKPSDREVVGELYLVKEGSRVDNVILKHMAGDKLSSLFSREIRGRYDYRVYYTDEGLYDKVAQLLTDTDLPITLIAVHRGENMISTAYEVSLETLRDFLIFIDNLSKGVTAEKRSRRRV